MQDRSKPLETKKLLHFCKSFIYSAPPLGLEPDRGILKCPVDILPEGPGGVLACP